MWQTITDPETMEPSAEFGRMLHNQHLNSENEKAMAPAWDQETYCLQSGSLCTHFIPDILGEENRLKDLQDLLQES